MPPTLLDDPSAAPTPGASPAHAPAAPRRLTEAERAARVRFRRALTLMVMTLVLPGSAQLVAGDRRVGIAALRTWFGLLVGAALLLLVGLVDRRLAFDLLSDTGALGTLRWLLVLVAVGWAALFVDAWRIGQPLTLRREQRLAVVGVNGVLCFTVAGALLFGAHLVTVQRDLVGALFASGEASGATDGRYNVLLLGGDAGAGRWGLRPDSITVASIDAETGRTVLIGLPRNLEDFPFREGSVMAEQFPDGFDCDGCYLNGVSTWAQDNPELFQGDGDPGVKATVQAVEGITDLTINYWAMVNLEGFKALVDAVGGVELTVRDRIPVGGLGSDVTGYIEPGTRVLDGFETLWFARAREGSDDYSRMARQKCVMNALVQQVSPQDALTNFQGIAEAGASMVDTNLPASAVGTFVDLALKARSQPISTVSLVPPLINTADPDMDVVHDAVATAIAKAEGEGDEGGAGERKARRAPATQTGGSLGSRDAGYAANEASDLGSAC